MVKNSNKKPPVSKLAAIKRIPPVVVATAIIACILIGGMLFPFVYVGSADPIKKVANKFQPEPNWTLIREYIEPPHFCIDVSCPSVDRQWKTQTVVTNVQLTKILHNAGWDFTIDRDCQVKTSEPTGGSICSADGKDGDFTIQIYVNDDATLQMFVY